MNGRKNSLFSLRENKEDDSDNDFKLYKSKDKYKYKINYVEKLKPKINIKIEENEEALKGVENQLKKILSNFMKTYESEINESENGYKPINSLKYNSSIRRNSTKKKVIKTKGTLDYKNYTNKILSKRKRSSIEKENIKKVHFQNSPMLYDKQTITQNSNRSVKYKLKKDSPNIFKKGKFFEDDNNNDKQHFKLELNDIKNTNSRIKRFSSWKIRKTSNNNINSLKHLVFKKKSSIRKIRTQKQNKNHITFQEDGITTSNKNNNKKIAKKFFSNSNLNTIKTNKNKLNLPNKMQICLSPSYKKSSLFKKSSRNKIKINPEEGYNTTKMASVKNIIHFETSDNDSNKIQQNEDKVKFLKLISDFKSIRQKIKKNIILRPEEDKENRKKENKKDNYKNPKKFYSASNLIKPTAFAGISKTNKEFLHSNTIGFDKDAPNQELVNNYEENIINNEKDINNNIEKNEKEKSESSKEYSFHSIKRKSIIICEKYRKITRKGAVYDSLDDEELEDEEEINRFYINPNSYFSFYFDLTLFIINILSFIEIPLYLAMNLNFCFSHRFSFSDTLNFLNEILNILDFLFGFFRAYYNWEEQLIKKNDKIIKKYLFGWCLFDLISCIPVYSLIKIFEPICDDNSKPLFYDSILDNIYYLFIINRLLKLLKIFSKNQWWKYISNKLSDFVRVFFNICLIMLALNYTACLYIFIARNSYPNWILTSGLDINEFKNIYICAIYVLIMTLTTVGYGDITCSSLKERIFQLVLLIIGIIAYSWLISSFSSLIQKINEKSIEYEKNKSILDDIKINNPNLSDSLYEKILQYFRFKYFHEKNVKNIIFDSLPVGLKNNLIFEMYKPVIKNFIFFKNFQNIDFIVQVITCFKPILAYKNYILVNEGDLIEDIIFVKHGVLSVELPVNLTNLQENIDKYLTINNSNKDKEKSTINNNTFSKIKNDTFSSFIGEAPKKLNSYIYNSTINSSFRNKSTFLAKSTMAKLKTIKIEKVNVKILCIRDNEHFGDVLMFLEERSPLQVRVRSKKCELYFLKKIDALKISTSYSHIWRRINKKSVYNFKQIKKNITKIVEIYCSVKNNKKNKEDIIMNAEFGLKKNEIWEHPKNYDSDNSALNSNNKNINKDKNKSEEEKEIKTNNLFFKKFGFEDVKNKIYSHKRCHSLKLLKKDFDSLFFKENNFSFSDSSSSSDVKQKKKPKKKIKKNKKSLQKDLTKNIIDVLNHNYTNYKDINQQHKENYKISKIDEKNKSDINRFHGEINRNTESVNKNSINSKIKETKKQQKRNSTNTKARQSLFGEFNINIDDNNEKIQNRKILINSSEDDNNTINDELIINNEIYPGESLEINNTENLLAKKINSNDNKKYDIKNYFNINFNIEQTKSNNKLDRLLKYFEEESKSNSKNIAQKEAVLNNSSKYLSIKANNSNKLLLNQEIDSNYDSSKNDLYSNLKTYWNSTLFSINNNISLTINSSYENYNIISGQKLIKSKNLQNKLKEYLLKESFNISNDNNENNEIIKKNKTTIQNKIDKNLTKKKISSSVVCGNTNNNSNIKNLSSIKNKRNFSTKIEQNYSPNDSYLENSSKNWKETYTRKNNNPLRKKLIKTRNSLSFIKPSKYTKNITISRNKSFNRFNNNNSLEKSDFHFETTKELPIKFRMKRRNSILISSNISKSRKRKDNLLALIGNNIKATNQKLNDPELFYNNYFSHILKEEMKEKSKKKY